MHPQAAGRVQAHRPAHHVDGQADDGRQRDQAEQHPLHRLEPGQLEDVEPDVAPDDGVGLSERLAVPGHQPQLPLGGRAYAEQHGHHGRQRRRRALQPLPVQADRHRSFRAHHDQLALRQRGQGGAQAHQQQAEHYQGGAHQQHALRRQRAREDGLVAGLAEPQPVGVEGHGARQHEDGDGDQQQQRAGAKGHEAHVDRSAANAQAFTSPSSDPRGPAVPRCRCVSRSSRVRGAASLVARTSRASAHVRARPGGLRIVPRPVAGRADARPARSADHQRHHLRGVAVARGGTRWQRGVERLEVGRFE